MPLREWAAGSLVSMRDTRAVPFFIFLLRTGDRHRRRWAARSLLAMPDTRAAQALSEARSREFLFRRAVFTRALRACRSL